MGFFILLLYLLSRISTVRSLKKAPTFKKKVARELQGKHLALVKMHIPRLL